jgi:hypothetical protein
MPPTVMYYLKGTRPPFDGSSMGIQQAVLLN